MIRTGRSGRPDAGARRAGRRPLHVFRRDRDERGVFAVVTAFAIIGLLGMGAFVVDLGMAWQEKREVQNGADAAAIATALNCIHGSCGDPGVTSQRYEDANSTDPRAGTNGTCGQAPVESEDLLQPCPDPVTPPYNSMGWVKVKTVSSDGSDGEHVSFSFGRLLGVNGVQVRTDAFAAWGAPRAHTTTPLMVSRCAWDRLVNGGSTAVPDYPLHSAEVTVWNNRDAYSEDPVEGSCGYTFLRGMLNCTGRPYVTNALDWKDVPAETDSAGKVLTAPPSGCETTTWTAGDREFVVPVYEPFANEGWQECSSPEGAYRVYKIVGFTHLRINAFRFSETQQNGDHGCGDGYCMKVQFSRIVEAADTQFMGPNLGVITYRLFDPADPNAGGSEPT